MKKAGILTTFAISLLTVPLYIYTFENGLWTFWIIFILDRILSPLLAPKFDKGLQCINVEANSDNEFKVLGKFMILIILFCIISMALMIYVLFKYPKLFIVLILGELLDKIAEKYLLKRN